MNDFEQGIGDEDIEGAFTTNAAPTEAPPSAPIKTEAPTPKLEPTTTPTPAAAAEIGATERSGSSVYIANLQWWTTDADVERLCSTYGPVLNINFLAERSNGKSKGVALVEFADSHAAARCKEGLSGCSIHGRSCVVTFPNQSYQRPAGGRYYYGHYERGRMPDGRGRGRHGRGYPGGYDGRPGMGMHMMGDMPGYMHEMGMMDMPPDVMPPIEGQMNQHGASYVPPPPYPIPGRGGYMHDEPYEQNPYYRPRGGERWDHGMEPEDPAQKRPRQAS